MAAGMFCALLGGPARADDPSSDLTPVTVVRVQRHDVPEYATGIGTVQAYRAVLVRARVDGALEKIAFREGQTVQPGDLLAEIDPRPYAATLAQAQAKRAADQAQLDNARRDLARYQHLVASNFASRQQADTQAALVSQYDANVQGDEAAIASAALNLSFCRITAPIGGVVGLRLVDIGNLIHATDATGIVSIAQIHPIALIFTLPQDQLPAVRAAMAASGGAPTAASGGAPTAASGGAPTVIATGQDGHKALSTGRLIAINNSIDTQTDTITLKAEFANADNALWPGQFVNAKVQLAVAKAALTVPPQAIQHGEDGLYVYIVRPGNIVEKRSVSVGYQDESTAIITAGLQADETIVLSGQVRLEPGLKVNPHPPTNS